MTFYEQSMGGSHVVVNPLGGWGFVDVEGVYASEASNQVYAAGISDDWWIKDPEAVFQASIEPDPEESEVFEDQATLLVYMEGSEFSIDYQQDTYIFEPLSRALPVIEYGTRRGRKTTLPINIVGDEDYHHLMRMIRANRTLVLQSPAGWQMFFRVDATRKENIRNTRDRYRLVELPIIEVYHEYAS